MYSVLSSISISDQRSRGAIAIPDPTAMRASSAWVSDRTYFAAMRG
jgi:hypothetical protein